ncbi:hypothetical protein EZV62_001849 [Acer yangbiense]|uniref:SPRY domain-containing protein n=1 Tax=Acer yangbiense TaxID=1000413 RepID=A0A5C7IVC2_9ROSI|nr:hypothetical protein EZV62_001849 [Acer yangbiense]
MDSLQANYREEEDDESEPPINQTPLNDTAQQPETEPESQHQLQNGGAQEPEIEPQPEPMVSDSVSEDYLTASDDTQKSPKPDDNHNAPQNDDEDDEDDEEPPPKKQKPLSSCLTTVMPQQEQEREPNQEQQDQEQTPVATSNNVASKANTTPTTTTAKKSKKKNNNVWVSKTTRKGKKKNKTNTQNQPSTEDTVLITPVPRLPDKGDDNPDMKICLSKVEKLGETGHTRLGWSTEKGDLQAPVGYDANSFGYRDIDGSKVHKALREKYGEEGYKEGDVIGFYINLPEGEKYAPKPPHFVWYKGQRYVCAPDSKEDPPKVVPGSEISFFKNGVCQGVAFMDLYGGRYYPAASMYTLPNQPNCEVKFNFGPDFERFPKDFGERPVPMPMIDVPYHGFDSRVENGEYHNISNFYLSAMQDGTVQISVKVHHFDEIDKEVAGVAEAATAVTS